ncbi:hypothetical protein Y032_0036g3160 [Ancylostoma ceylanicum]|nr:hypothetical protein Y032_0036g3160 [Ancylostoma ceylanicum]
MKLTILVLVITLAHFTLGCGENEVDDRCFNGCEPTCSEPNIACTFECGPGGCRCKEGYLRNKAGNCVPKNKC